MALLDIEARRKLFSSLQFIISTLTFGGLTVLIIAILSSKKTRVQPFNIYLVNLEIVDAVLNLLYVFVALWYWRRSTVLASTEDISQNEQQQNETDQKLTTLTNALVLFATTANMWLNGVVGYQIHRLLKNSHLAIRVSPPTFQRIRIETLVCYGLAICLSFGYYVLSINHININNTNGQEGFDNENDDDGNDTNDNEEQKQPQPVAWALVIAPAVPLIYILYIIIRIWKDGLLPISDQRTRTMTIYFGRIVFVFFVFYLPGTIFFVLGLSLIDRWASSVGNLLFALQGSFSLGVALMKPDVYDSVRQLFRRCCNCCCYKNCVEHKARKSGRDENNRREEEILTNIYNNNGVENGEDNFVDSNDDSKKNNNGPIYHSSPINSPTNAEDVLTVQDEGKETIGRIDESKEDSISQITGNNGLISNSAIEGSLPE